MVYNTQNYWVFGLIPSSGILENTTFRKLDLYPSSGESGGEDTYSVGPLRKSYSILSVVPLPLYEAQIKFIILFSQ
jgi:hypothetical protein